MVALFLSWAPALARGLDYQVRYATPGDASVHVRITLPQELDGPRPLVFPRAIPMGYGEQPYDRFVLNMRAFSGTGERIPCLRIEGPRWVIGSQESKLKSLEYDVDIARMEREILSGADSSKVRKGYAGLLGYSIFGFIEGTERLTINLSVGAPEGWPVFSTLAPREFPSEGRCAAQARDFYALADSQILMGPDLRVRKLDAGVPLFLALYGEAQTDADILANTVGEAFSAVASYFEKVPFPHYTVCQEYLRPLSDKHEYGFSMEHLESGTFFFAVEQALSDRATPDELARARYNFAHHIAHAWIPKRSAGEGYFPFRWERAPIIDSVWFSEGFPQYAAIAALAATMPEAEAQNYRERMLEIRFRTTLREAPEFIRRLSLIGLSRLASTRYSEDFRIGRSVFSRGGLMAAEMDERIRKESGGRKSLRDALRYLVDWSARSGRAFRIEELPSIIAQATGVETRDIMARWMPAPDRQEH